MLAPRAGKMNEIARYDWLPERVRSARSGLPAVSSMKNFPRKPCNKSFIDQVCSVKMAGYWPRSVLCEFMDRDEVEVHKHGKKRTWPISSHLDLTLGQ